MYIDIYIFPLVRFQLGTADEFGRRVGAFASDLPGPNRFHTLSTLCYNY